MESESKIGRWGRGKREIGERERNRERREIGEGDREEGRVGGEREGESRGEKY